MASIHTFMFDGKDSVTSEPVGGDELHLTLTGIGTRLGILMDRGAAEKLHGILNAHLSALSDADRELAVLA